MKRRMIYPALFSLLAGGLLQGCWRVGDLSTPSTAGYESDASSQEKKSLYCSNDTMLYDFEIQADRLLTQKQVFSMPLSRLLPDETDENADVTIRVEEALAGMYQDVDGVEAKGKLEGDQVEIAVTIDFQKADLQWLIDQGLILPSSSGSHFVSAASTRSQLEKEGFACREEVPSSNESGD